MSEATYQKKLIKELEADGYYVLKLIKTNKNGICDLLAIRSQGKLCDVKFIEVKGKLTKVSELQKYRIKELKKLGFNATIDRE